MEIANCLSFLGVSHHRAEAGIASVWPQNRTKAIHFTWCRSRCWRSRWNRHELDHVTVRNLGRAGTDEGRTAVAVKIEIREIGRGQQGIAREKEPIIICIAVIGSGSASPVQDIDMLTGSAGESTENKSAAGVLRQGRKVNPDMTWCGSARQSQNSHAGSTIKGQGSAWRRSFS